MNSAKMATRKPLISTAALAAFERGEKCFGDEDYEGAVKEFSEAIGLDPYFAAAWNERGLACHVRGEFAAAVSDYTEALKLVHVSGAGEANEVKALLLARRGEAYAGLERSDDAIRDFNEAVELDPKFADFYVGRALTGIVSTFARTGKISRKNFNGCQP